jgi:hypothetical protein
VLLSTQSTNSWPANALSFGPVLVPAFSPTVQVLVTDPKELEAIRQRESDITKERVQKILDAGQQQWA